MKNKEAVNGLLRYAENILKYDPYRGKGQIAMRVIREFLEVFYDKQNKKRKLL